VSHPSTCTARPVFPERHVHAGHCVDIDGCTWHQDGQRCDCCGFGVDVWSEGGPSTGEYGEPFGTVDATALGCRRPT